VLQGKIPGVSVTSTSGVSGTGTNIVIRGYSSITGSNQPLFVVDGVPFNSNTNQRGGFTQGGQSSSSRFLDLDPNSIESVTVLKGLAATVTYGDQGRNGVILVTTKSGSKKARKAEFQVPIQLIYQIIRILMLEVSNRILAISSVTGDQRLRRQSFILLKIQMLL
jgi:TonB-dependent SusC/RagA subfamily outer membrane receptor